MFVLLFSSLLPLFPSSFLLFSFVLAFFSSSSSPCFTFSTEPSPFSRFFFFSNLSYLFFSSFLTSEASSFLTLNCTMIFLKKKKKKKKTAAQVELAGNRKGWAERSQAMHQIDIRARAQSWALRERFRSCQWASFLNFYGNVVSSRATVTAHMVGCASRSTVTEPFERFTRRSTSFFQKKKKKQPLANRKIQKPSALKRKILAGNMRQENSGEVDKRRASLTIFSRAKWMNKAGQCSGCPVSNPDPNNTIGLF